MGCANKVASGNSVSCLNYYEISYKTTPHLFNFDVSFTSDSHSDMEFTNAEVVGGSVSVVGDGPKTAQTRIDKQEDFTVYLVGLEGNHPL